MRKLFLPIVLVAFLAGCGEPKLDASSDTAMKESIQEMNKNLSPEDQAKFQRAIAKTIFKVGFSSGDAAQKDQKFKEALNGKTAKEIIAMDEKK
ncbi:MULTISPECIES: DUF6694 family lipoprotein [Photorhabdus]|uniref:Lipoprotein n=1 Tax=Photorhabdus asymbiotica TaxID=291112 RepID=A0ABX9SND5_9GAMM|nr:DUF6694 family lipoprotein [Photorhabdus asymbiotica]RKS59550.1 hypothetical protein BDD30_1626 [Photorhabdus asymbiotica]